MEKTQRSERSFEKKGCPTLQKWKSLQNRFCLFLWCPGRAFYVNLKEFVNKSCDIATLKPEDWNSNLNFSDPRWKFYDFLNCRPHFSVLKRIADLPDLASTRFPFKNASLSLSIQQNTKNRFKNIQPSSITSAVLPGATVYTGVCVYKLGMHPWRYREKGYPRVTDIGL